MSEEDRSEENFFMNQYNATQAIKQPKRTNVYIPPHKLQQFEKDLQNSSTADKATIQRAKWEVLKREITSLVNKVNTANIENVILELFNQNLLYAKGIFVSSVLRAQSASPSFSSIYVCLIAVINSKLPEIGNLFIQRTIQQFRRAFKRSHRLTCMSSIKLIAHLINQKILTDFFALEMLIFLLEVNTSDSIEMAINFMVDVGQVLIEQNEVAATLVFERFKTLNHEGEVERKIQFKIEGLFAIRKNGFKEHKGVPKEFDLIEEKDQITHVFGFDEEISPVESEHNIFKFDPELDEKEKEWEEIKIEILGEETIEALRIQSQKKTLEMTNEGNVDQINSKPTQQGEIISDMTQESLVSLRQSIYLRIMNSIDFEECAHKLLQMRLPSVQLEEMINMIIDCCAEERVYINYYGLLGERLCKSKEDFTKLFHKSFVERFSAIDEYNIQKIRKMGKFFAHLLSYDALDWFVLRCIELKEETTTSSSRIFLKVLLQDLSTNLGIRTLIDRFADVDMKDSFEGLFPTDSLENMEFAINFYISIGLKGLTDDYRDEFKRRMEVEEVKEEEIEQLGDEIDKIETKTEHRLLKEKENTTLERKNSFSKENTKRESKKHHRDRNHSDDDVNDDSSSREYRRKGKKLIKNH